MEQPPFHSEYEYIDVELFQSSHINLESLSIEVVIINGTTINIKYWHDLHSL